MNPYGISGLLAGFSYLSVGLLVLFQSPNRKVRWIWFCFAVSVAVYSIGVFFFTSAKSAEKALLYVHISYAFGVVWIATLFHHFVCAFLEIKSQRMVILNYLVSLVFLSLVFTPLFFVGAPWRFNSIYYPLAGRAFPLFVAWWMALVFYSHYQLLRFYRTVPAQKRLQIRYFFLATAVGFTGGSTGYFANFGLDIYPWGNFTIVLYPYIMAYAILKHHLMDINIIIRKTVVYSLLTGILAAIMVFVAMISAHFTEGYLGYKTFYALAVAACLITAIFHPLQRKVQAFVDKLFFRGWQDREAVREVASGFSHELKSPLAGLSMQAQLALMELEDFEKHHPSLKRDLTKLKDEMHYIVNQAMDAARRIEAVRGVAEPTRGQMEPVQVADLINNSMASLQSLIGPVKVAIHKDLPERLAPVRGDAKQLEIVFINLMKNALQAMDGLNGGQVHSLSLSGQERDGSVLISIKDTGPGIAPRDVGRIFEPYFTTKGHKGTGMGLYLSQQIIKAHGGSIEVRSEEGKGTEFLVRLPKYIEASEVQSTRLGIA